MTGVALIMIGAALWWVLTAKADDLNLSDEFQQGMAVAAYATAGLGALLLLG